MVSARKKRRTGGPMSAAGLISFYEEYEEKLTLSPTTIVIISIVFTAAVILAHALG